MSKLFTLPEQNLRFRWDPPSKVKTAVSKLRVVDLEPIEPVDMREAILDTYRDFKLAAQYGINDVKLNVRDAKSVCLLYLKRDILAAEGYTISLGLETFILQYIKDNISKCLSYAISIFFSFYDKAKYYIKLFGEVISHTLGSMEGERFSHWKEHTRLFEENPEVYALQLLRDVNYSFSSLVETLGLKEEGHIVSPFMESTVRELFKSKQLGWKEKVQMLSEVFKEKRYEASLAEAINFILQDNEISTTIRNRDVSQIDSCIERTLSFLIDRWGDPRVSAFTGGNWRYVSREVKDYFRVMLAKNDLDIFFYITDQLNVDTKWRYRKKFWEAYLPYIIRTHVILGHEGRRYAARYNEQHPDTVLKFGGLGYSTKSAFIFEIKDAIIVEWSDNGKLSFILYPSQYFRENIFKLDYTTESKLKADIREYSDEEIVHRGSVGYTWQEKAADFLWHYLGVKPKKTYRFDSSRCYIGGNECGK